MKKATPKAVLHRAGLPFLATPLPKFDEIHGKQLKVLDVYGTVDLVLVSLASRLVRKRRILTLWHQ